MKTELLSTTTVSSSDIFGISEAVNSYWLWCIGVQHLQDETVALYFWSLTIGISFLAKLLQNSISRLWLQLLITMPSVWSRVLACDWHVAFRIFRLNSAVTCDHLR